MCDNDVQGEKQSNVSCRRQSRLFYFLFLTIESWQRIPTIQAPVDDDTYIFFLALSAPQGSVLIFHRSFITVLILTVDVRLRDRCAFGLWMVPANT